MRWNTERKSELNLVIEKLEVVILGIEFEDIDFGE